MHLQELKHSRRCQRLTAKDCERGKTEKERDGGALHKSVDMASTSRYCTDRRYVRRKPLFTAEHTSELKKTQPQEHREKELQFGREQKQEPTDRNFIEGAREELALSHDDTLPLCAPIGDPGSLNGSELRAGLYHEGPTFLSTFSDSKSAQRCISSSILEIQRLKPTLRPRLTSTVLNPTYTPRLGYSRSREAQLRWKGGVEEETKPFCSRGQSKRMPMSHHQADYWASAIPKAAPPFSDRYSAGWDPNKEYQAMLDYTYPLRPGQSDNEWDSSEVQEECLLQTDLNLQDSGIELDHICSSTSLSRLGSTVNWMGQSRDRNTCGWGHQSPYLQRFHKSSYGLPSTAVQLDLSLDTVDYFKDRCAVRSDGHHELSPDIFSHCTSDLPKSRCVWGEVDEEFRRLPEQLEGLQLLSSSVREVTVQLSRPISASWKSLGPEVTSILSSITTSATQEAENKEFEDTDEWKDGTSREKRPAVHTAAHHGHSGAARRGSAASVEPFGSGLTGSCLREVEALVKQLCGVTLSDSQTNSQEEKEESDSLMQHVQVFCSHLQRLIQQLHKMSEKMELLVAPTLNMDSVKSSLAEYQSLQREMGCHLPLASSVLHTGQLLLSCINTTSPVLRDTLLLIEKQSDALHNQNEHFLSCTLSAVDSLTEPRQPSEVQQSRDTDQGCLGVQRCNT